MKRGLSIVGRGLRLSRVETVLLLAVFGWSLAAVAGRQALALLVQAEKETQVAAADYALLGLYILDFYLTVCVYAALSRTVRGMSITVGEFFAGGWRFLGRMLLYNLFALLTVMVLVTIPVFVNESLADRPLAVAAPLVGLAMIWVAVPLYLLFLTALAPFIVLVTDGPVIPAIPASFFFMRRNLATVLTIVVCLAVPMAVALGADKFYNSTTVAHFQFTALRTLALVYLEIAAAKSLLLVCFPERKEAHEGTV